MLTMNGLLNGQTASDNFLKLFKTNKQDVQPLHQSRQGSNFSLSCSFFILNIFTEFVTFHTFKQVQRH